MAHSPMIELLDLDAEVLHEYHHEVISWVGSLAAAQPQVVDLGAGSGTGTLALARELPGARVTAVDMDEEMLAHVGRKALEAGLADRVRTVRADLDNGWPELEPADLIWASASMHHMADPVDVLTRAYGTLRDGGLIAITELDSFPRFLTAPAADAALEGRVHAAAAEARVAHGMHMDADWGDRLTAAGFAVEAERRFDIDLRPPLPASAARYAEVSLGRVRHGLADRLDAGELDALDTLVAGLPKRDDLSVRATRTVWLGRKRSQ